MVKKIFTSLMVIFAFSLLFASCSTTTDTSNQNDGANVAVDNTNNQNSQDTNIVNGELDDTLEEELVSEDDDVDIGELI